MTQLIVIQNSKSTANEKSGKGYIISYTLSKPREYKENHFARLVSLSGAKEVVLVFTDIVQLQEVNGELKPFLGSSSTSSQKTWVPLVNDRLPSLGLVYLEKANSLPLPAGKNITLIIEIASRSWINGTKSSGRL